MKILHVCTLAWMGGVNSFIMSFKNAFSEFQHEILFTSDVRDNYKCYQDLQTQGIRCYYSNELTSELFEKINPKIIILHNPPSTLYPNKLKDLNILQKYHTIQYYHNRCKIFPHIDLSIFVSNWIKDAYKGFEKFMKKSKIVYPCVDDKPYINIERQYTKKENVVVGRIQSNTNSHLGKFSEDVSLLKKLKNSNFFLVGDGYEKTDDKRFTFAPMGNMVKYLEKVDIFYIWGAKGHTESWSRVVTEAMLSGLPVVIRNMNDGMAEQVRESKAGFLVETEEEFLETIQTLIDNPKLRKFHGEAGKEWAKNNVTIKNLRSSLIDEMFEFGVG